MVHRFPSAHFFLKSSSFLVIQYKLQLNICTFLSYIHSLIHQHQARLGYCGDNEEISVNISGAAHSKVSTCLLCHWPHLRHSRTRTEGKCQLVPWRHGKAISPSTEVQIVHAVGPGFQTDSRQLHSQGARLDQAGSCGTTSTFSLLRCMLISSKLYSHFCFWLMKCNYCVFIININVNYLFTLFLLKIRHPFGFQSAILPFLPKVFKTFSHKNSILHWMAMRRYAACDISLLFYQWEWLWVSWYELSVWRGEDDSQTTLSRAIGEA